jgi:hypothetical protein
MATEANLTVPLPSLECSIDNWTLMQTGQIFLATVITPPEYVFRSIQCGKLSAIPSELLADS